MAVSAMLRAPPAFLLRCIAIVPVESRRVVSEFVDDLVHLERREDGLDEHRGADAALRHTQAALRKHEHVVPQARLAVGLHLREVEVRAGAALQKLGESRHR